MLSERRSCSWSLMLPDVESDGARTGPELKLDVVTLFSKVATDQRTKADEPRGT